MHPFPTDTRVRIIKHSHIPEHIGKCGRVKFNGMGYAIKIDGDPLLAICSEDEVEEENPAMTILKCGFDKTVFEDAATWQEILDQCQLRNYRELPDQKGFEWSNERLTVVTGDNPITGFSRIIDMRHECTPGWAGFIGIEGDAQYVLEFVALVFVKSYSYKAFDAFRRSYI